MKHTILNNNHFIKCYTSAVWLHNSIYTALDSSTKTQNSTLASQHQQQGPQHWKTDQLTFHKLHHGPSSKILNRCAFFSRFCSLQKPNRVNFNFELNYETLTLFVGFACSGSDGQSPLPGQGHGHGQQGHGGKAGWYIQMHGCGQQGTWTAGAGHGSGGHVGQQDTGRQHVAGQYGGR